MKEAVAAAKMPIREAIRLFERMARENEQRMAELEGQIPEKGG